MNKESEKKAGCL